MFNARKKECKEKGESKFNENFQLSRNNDIMNGVETEFVLVTNGCDSWSLRHRNLVTPVMKIAQIT